MDVSLTPLPHPTPGLLGTLCSQSPVHMAPACPWQYSPPSLCVPQSRSPSFTVRGTLLRHKASHPSAQTVPGTPVFTPAHESVCPGSVSPTPFTPPPPLCSGTSAGPCFSPPPGILSPHLVFFLSPSSDPYLCVARKTNRYSPLRITYRC